MQRHYLFFHEKNFFAKLFLKTCYILILFLFKKNKNKRKNSKTLLKLEMDSWKKEALMSL